jgi:hypothetical protein
VTRAAPVRRATRDRSDGYVRAPAYEFTDIRSSTTVASLEVPAGKYVVNAKAWVSSTHQGGPVLVQCGLIQTVP